MLPQRRVDGRASKAPGAYKAALKRAPAAIMVTISISLHETHSASFPSSAPQVDDPHALTRRSSAPEKNLATENQQPTRKSRNVQETVSPMLKELYPYNKGPEIGIEPQFQPPNRKHSKARTTRNTVNAYRQALRHEPLTPRKSLNVREMFRAQVDDRSGAFDESCPMSANPEAEHTLDLRLQVHPQWL